MRRRVLICVLIFAFCACGCWDRTAVEDRLFVTLLALDKDGDGRFAVSAVILETSKDAVKPGVKQSSGGVLAEALRTLGANTGKVVCLEQVKTLVIGEKLLADAALLRETLEYINAENAIDRRALIFASRGEAAEAVERYKKQDAPQAAETLPGLYAAEFFRDNSKAAGVTFKQDFQSLYTALSVTGRALVPVIFPELSGLAAVADYALSGWLDEIETRGCLWTRPGACLNAVVAFDGGEPPAAFTVEKHRVKLYFAETGERLSCVINVSVSGKLSGGEPDAPLSVVEDIIRNEIAHTAGVFQVGLHADCYNLRENLRKTRYALFRKYAVNPDDWGRAFVEMEIVPRVTVRV